MAAAVDGGGLAAVVEPAEEKPASLPIARRVHGARRADTCSTTPAGIGAANKERNQLTVSQPSGGLEQPAARPANLSITRLARRALCRHLLHGRGSGKLAERPANRSITRRVHGALCRHLLHGRGLRHPAARPANRPITLTTPSEVSATSSRVGFLRTPDYVAAASAVQAARRERQAAPRGHERQSFCFATGSPATRCKLPHPSTSSAKRSRARRDEAPFRHLVVDPVRE